MLPKNKNPEVWQTIRPSRHRHEEVLQRTARGLLEATLPSKGRIFTEAFVFYIWNYYFGPTQCLETLKARSLSLLHFRKLNK